MSPKTGRSHSDNPRLVRVETRMTPQELERLDFCCKITEKPRSKIVRAGIDVIYTYLRNSEKNKRKRPLSTKEKATPPHHNGLKDNYSVNIIIYAMISFKGCVIFERKIKL